MKLKLFSVGVASVLVLMGCQGTTNEEGMNNRDGTGTNVEQTRYNDNDNTRDNRMNEINDNNRRDRMDDTRDRDRDRDRNITDNQNRNETDDARDRDDDRYEVSEEAADKITDDVEEIDSAYVLTMKNNAYVAATLDNERDNNREDNDNKNDNANRNNADNTNNADSGKELTDDVKEQISDIVQSVDNDIDNVYVTTNPDFADLTNDYVDDMNEGKPVRGFFDQIGNMIDRVFPQDKR